MMEKIESKMTEVVERILDKPIVEITKDEYDILSSEFGRLKSIKDAEEHRRKMAETMVNLINNS